MISSASRHLAALVLLGALPLAGGTGQTAPAPAPTTSPATTRALSPLPAIWHGKYAGTTVFQVPGKTAQTIPMELSVAPLAGGNAVVWVVTFIDGEKRKSLAYQLDPIPGHRDRFLMDDHNLGQTDQALVGNALVGLFNVPGSTVYSRFERRDDGVEVELCNFVVAPRKSGLPGAGVQSYPLFSLQRGLLRKVP